MRAAFFRMNLQPCAGLVVAPLAWAANTQLSEMLPSVECRAGWPVLATVSLACVLASLGAALLSWSSIGRPPSAARQWSAFPLTLDFVGMLGTLSGAGFAFVLALQGLSSLMLTGCER